MRSDKNPFAWKRRSNDWRLVMVNEFNELVHDVFPECGEIVIKSMMGGQRF